MTDWPCKSCEFRKVNCHADCASYEAAQSEYRGTQDENWRSRDYVSYKIDFRNRYLKKKGAHKK